MTQTADGAQAGPQGGSRQGVPQQQGPTPNVNPFVRKWIDDCVELCQPDRVVWCDGSVEERRRLYEQGVRDGVFVRLNQEKWPGCYYHRSNSNDVARTEHLTFICTPSPDTAGA